MQIAITGATGFIGTWLVNEAKINHKIIVVGLKEEKELIQEEENIIFFETDYSIESLNEIFTNEIDAVIHLAAQRPKSKSNDRSISEFSVNINLAYNVFEACRQKGIKNIVYTSSISVYGSSNKVPFSEDILPQPNGLYGLAKLGIDNMSDYFNRKQNMAIKSLRLAHVFGLGEKEGFMFMIFVNKAHNKEKLTIFGKGEGRREYIYVKDVVDAILNAIKSSKANGIFNIGTGINTSHLELAEIINEVFENKNNLGFKDFENEDKSVDLLNTDKAKLQLNWQNNFSLKNALEDMKTILNS